MLVYPEEGGLTYPDPALIPANQNGTTAVICLSTNNI